MDNEERSELSTAHARGFVRGKFLVWWLQLLWSIGLFVFVGVFALIGVATGDEVAGIALVVLAVLFYFIGSAVMMWRIAFSKDFIDRWLP